MLIIGLSVFVFGLFMLLESLHIVTIMNEVYFSAFVMLIGAGIIYEVLSRRCQKRCAITSATAHYHQVERPNEQNFTIAYCHQFERPDEQKERKQAEKH